MILFCEYSVPEPHREAFLAWAFEDASRWDGVQFLENEAQRGVFVEIRHPKDAEEAARTEKERREGRSWKEMERWVKGGRDGVRIWKFRPVFSA